MWDSWGLCDAAYVTGLCGSVVHVLLPVLALHSNTAGCCTADWYCCRHSVVCCCLYPGGAGLAVFICCCSMASVPWRLHRIRPCAVSCAERSVHVDAAMPCCAGCAGHGWPACGLVRCGLRYSVFGSRWCCWQATDCTGCNMPAAHQHTASGSLLRPCCCKKVFAPYASAPVTTYCLGGPTFAAFLKAW